MCRSAVFNHNSLWTNCAVDHGLFEVWRHKTKLLTRRSRFRNEHLASCMMLCLFFCGKSMRGRSHYKLWEPMRSDKEQETDSQLIMQRWFFSSKRTCHSLSQKNLSSETTPLHADLSLRFCMIQIWTLYNRFINVVSIWKLETVQHS